MEEGSRFTEVLGENGFCVVTNNSRVWRTLDVTEVKVGCPEKSGFGDDFGRD